MAAYPPSTNTLDGALLFFRKYQSHSVDRVNDGIPGVFIRASSWLLKAQTKKYSKATLLKLRKLVKRRHLLTILAAWFVTTSI